MPLINPKITLISISLEKSQDWVLFRYVRTPSQIVALAACRLYCAASSATLASAGARPTDLGALRAPCDGMLGQLVMKADGNEWKIALPFSFSYF
jgi:hypothetical protein